ncbi:hypothetical protein BLNAU_19767 [Blattamonas nauphoetae]|uniref:Uncharacterized protein n=1 Tax=Blattamonas nauphoetae TaxID=2049346 RepID=A0ABQ9X1U5_9EUKA|nr:hypothetical protein BLNAU_19767 [Blattamonas nauphoetae]
MKATPATPVSYIDEPIASFTILRRARLTRMTLEKHSVDKKKAHFVMAVSNTAEGETQPVVIEPIDSSFTTPPQPFRVEYTDTKAVASDRSDADRRRAGISSDSLGAFDRREQPCLDPGPSPSNCDIRVAENGQLNEIKSARTNALVLTSDVVITALEAQTELELFSDSSSSDLSFLCGEKTNPCHSNAAAEECEVSGTDSTPNSPLFIPTLDTANSAVTLNKKTTSFLFSLSGSLLIECGLSVEVYEINERTKLTEKDISLPLSSVSPSRNNESSLVFNLTTKELTQFLNEQMEWQMNLGFGKDHNLKWVLLQKRKQGKIAQSLGRLFRG